MLHKFLVLTSNS